MSYGSYSEEVAEDYRKALEDLTMNSRYEISNLTVIAKENTEHALAISDALKNHIKTTAPAKKLPAFYVLDSVVKNVGTPYTLFFGRNLYSTFMEAYALVDSNVRRKMEEMLRTWKEPVPGSIDTRPVFPVEVTRPIETALIRARTSAIQAEQERARNSAQPQLNRVRPGTATGMASVPYRNTPTPPNTMRAAPYPAPGYTASQERTYITPANDQTFRNSPFSTQQASQFPLPTSTAPVWQQQAAMPAQITRPMDISIDALNSDIANLITVSKSDFAQNPWDSTIQTRLKALLDLQSILQSQRLPPDQLAAIRDQVTKLSLSARPQAPPTPVARPLPVAQPPQQPTLSSLLGQGGLAALLARTSATPQIQSPTPQPAVPVPSPQPAVAQPYQSSISQPSKAPAATPNPNPNALLDQLRAAGLLPPVASATNTPPPPVLQAAPPTSLAANFPQLSSLLGGVPVANGNSLKSDIPNDVELKPNSLKIPRPHLISLLYERLGAPCTQCGRRFKSDEEGKMKKKAHMDWHFRVNSRMSDAEKRGQHRSWYVDELDWISSRESQDDYLSGATNGVNATEGASTSPATTAPKQHYIVIPESPPNTLCPICQEKFEAKYLDDAQEWVWMDAIQLGGRIYHATCHAETAVYQRGTPDPESILGKRKAEDDQISLRTRIKAEPL